MMKNTELKLSFEDKITLYVFIVLITTVFVFYIAKPLIVSLGLCSALLNYCKLLSALFFNSTIQTILNIGLLFAALKLILGNIKKYRYLNLFSPYLFDNDKLNNIVSKFNRKIKIYVINKRQPIAFSAGIFNPALYLSKGTIKHLDEPKLNAIIYHEIAHIINKDILHLTIAQFTCDVFFYLPFLRVIFYKLKTKKEFLADGYAALKSGDANFVIDALLRFSQLTLRHSSAIAFFGSKTDVIKRINRLQGKVDNTNTRNKMILLLTLISAVIISIFAVNTGISIASSINCPMHQPVTKIMHR